MRRAEPSRDCSCGNPKIPGGETCGRVGCGRQWERITGRQPANPRPVSALDSVEEAQYGEA
jgi:hypothetical protein